ncbi:MAG: hypothetical protein AB7O62_16820 [Pirellulales bacterium]
MWQILNTRTAQVAVWLALLASLVVVGIYIIQKVRAGFTGRGPASSEMLTSFRELHSQGQLSDAEYRNIKTKLADRLQHDVQDRAPDAEPPADQKKPE